jgi:hypothetical protein
MLVNVELALTALQETVTVTGESPVIDTSATRVQQNFKLEQLQRTITTGTAFLRPTAILAPRTARLGARVSW